MFDFPTSPTSGQASNGYVFDGEKWLGNPGTAAPVTEQFFDVTGLSTKDITVPAWAKSCEIEGLHWAQGVYGLLMRYSVDGTTFLAGASDYGYQGPFHNTGSNLYQTQVAASTTAMYLTYQSDNAAVPHHYVANITLTRGDTAKVLGWMQANAHAMDTATTSYGRTFWLSGYLGSTSAGSALAVKAIRILSGGPTWTTGSFIRVKWFGDLAQVPTGNAIADAPADGGEYVRVNGVWRLKSQTFVMDGLNSIDVTVPASARSVTVEGSMNPSASASPLVRISTDGTTFLAGASDYTLSGLVENSGVPGLTHQAEAPVNYMALGPACEPTVPPATFTASLTLTRLSGQQFVCRCYGRGFVAAASNRYLLAWYTSTCSAGQVAPASIKALRFMCGSGGQLAQASSWLDVRWSY